MVQPRASRLAHLAVLVAVASPALAGETDSTAAQRTFAIRYQVKFPAPPAGAKTLEAWVPLPLEDEVQRIADLKVEASVPHEVTKEEMYGNRMAHVKVVSPPSEEVTITWSATITRIEDRGQGKGPVLDAFRKGDELIPLSGTASKLAEELKAKDTAMPVRERARRVYDYVLKTMTYDKDEPGWGRGDFERACSLGKGNCADYESKFGGILRAGGIPVRWTVGIHLTPETAKCPACGYHCWSHFHDGTSWVPADSSDAARAPAKTDYYFGNADVNRIALTIGRDVVLSPRQQGKPLYFFGGPYLEVDGKPVNVPNERKTYDVENK